MQVSVTDILRQLSRHSIYRPLLLFETNCMTYYFQFCVCLLAKNAKYKCI